jgi:CheY-like chemotaxis protein
MADRHVLLVDTDKKFQDTLKKALQPYGVDVVVVDDGSDGISRARELSPELVVIAVEMPKREGYGIFSKARKTLGKKVPIALVTSSVSADDFSKHQKLNAHADEYIDKRTISRDDLLRRVDRLIALGEPIAEGDELELSVDDAEELAIEEEIAVVDEIPGDGELEGDVGGGAGLDYDDRTRVSGALVDEGIDAETDAAFAALGMGGEETSFEVDESSTDLHRGVGR